jgi:hypothetical protein
MRIILSLFLITAALFAAEPGTVLRIPRVQRAPKLADFLAGRPREAELVITDFRQFMPGDGAPVSQPTTAYVSYDDKNFYVAAVCKDDPALIRARYAKHDQIMTDDRFTVNIDTFHDHHRAYWFDVNPYGIKADGNVTDGVEDDPSWDTLWQADAKITPDGYVVLFAIPFKSIRFPKDQDQTWGFIIGRWIVRNNEMSLWPHISRSRPGWVRQAGDLEGLQMLSAGRNVQLIPYGSFAASRYLDAPAARFSSEREPRVGIDAKAVLKDAFTLDLTVNPDFSQVESDEPQVTVNQRYEVFFPEKRPFFLENAGFFKTPQVLFHSRRIADPEFGARLTGKMGRWAVGLLAADDRAPGRLLAASDPFHGDRAGIGVLRLQREFLKDSNAALMVTSRDFGNTHNRVASFDTRIRVLPNWILTGQAMSSDTRLPDGAHLSGPGYYASFAHAGRHFISQTSYTDYSPQFRSEVGFINRVDIRQAEHTVGYLWQPEDRTIVSFGPQLKTLINYDRLGRLQDWSINPEFTLELPRMTQLGFERWEGFELYADRGFRKHHTEITLDSDLLSWLALKAGLQRGSAVNYYPHAGLAPFTASSTNLEAGFTLRPTPRLRLEETYMYTRLASVFNNHLARAKANYQFNRALSLRAILDYSAVLPNPSLVSLDREKHVGADVLLTYMLNPGTALYLGYTDLYDNLKLDPTVSPVLKRTAFPDLNTGRQVFVKLSYLLRF